MSGTNCFGMLSRETGHSLVPAPPHMITGMILAGIRKAPVSDAPAAYGSATLLVRFHDSNHIKILVLRSAQRRQVYAVCAGLTALRASRRTAPSDVAPASMLRDGATLLSMRFEGYQSDQFRGIHGLGYPLLRTRWARNENSRISPPVEQALI